MEIRILITIMLFVVVLCSHAQQTDTFNDPRDGKYYETVRIGKQVWMAENLNYTINKGSWCYDNKSINCDKYGRLYNWETARNACPSGWHLPSHEEWIELLDHIGNNAGRKLKAREEWELEGNGTDIYGFTALPGGYQLGYLRTLVFTNIGYWGKWWTSTSIDDHHAWYKAIQFSSSNVLSDYIYGKEIGLSIRCIMDK